MPSTNLAFQSRDPTTGTYTQKQLSSPATHTVLYTENPTMNEDSPTMLEHGML